MIKKRFISIVIVLTIFVSLFVPVYGDDTVTDIYKADTFVINKIEVKENIVTVSGRSDTDVMAALVRPGYKYKDYQSNELFMVASDIDYFETVSGSFKVKFVEENVSDGYSLFLSNGTNQLEVPVSDYLRSVTIYVSPSGNDENDGTQEKPLKTLEAARQKVSEYNSGDSGVKVILKAGIYDYETVTFTEADSGKDGAEIVYQADGVEFRGTKQIPVSAFSKVSDMSVRAKLKDGAVQNVVCADLAECGFTKDDIDFLSNHNAGNTAYEVGVYVDSKRQTLARYPNDKYMKIDGVIREGGTIRYNDGEGITAQFYQYDSNLRRWENAENAYGVGFFGVEFYSEWAEIESIDGSLQTISFADRTMYGVKQNYKWYITNLIEELDIPGEWYIDKDEMKIYYFPTEDFDANSKFEITVQNTAPITVNGASDITFEGFKIFGTNSDGIKISDGNNISIKNCDISHTRGFGINMSGNNLTVDGCTIHNTYNAGIFLEKSGNRMLLQGSGNVISNNHIYKTGTDAASNWNGGIYIERNNVGTKVINNLIHSIKNYSYSFGGNDNEFAYNEVWAGNRETADTIPVYCGRDFSEYGNKILYNYIHDNFNEDTDIVYWNYGLASGDDAQAGTIIENNIVRMGKLTRTVGIGSGSRDNVVKDNIIIGAQYGIYMADQNKYIDNWFETDADNVKTIIASLDKSSGLEEGYSKTEAWLNAYPQISQIRKDIEDNGGKFKSVNNIITGNVSVEAPNYIEYDYYPTEWGNDFTNNKEFTDYKIFVDPDNHDYRIKDSAAREYGISSGVITESNFKMSDIGIQKKVFVPRDEFKLIWPYNQSVVGADDLTLSWTEAEFSDEYFVQIATDKEFSNIVYEDTVIHNKVCPEGLSAGNTYYWRVDAKNLSKQIGNSWRASNEMFSFSIADGKVSASNSSYKITDEETVINLNITNHTADNVLNKKLYYAFYDGERLKAVKANTISILSGETFEETHRYTDITDFSSVKMMLLDENLVPFMMATVPYERQYIAGEEYEITTFGRIGTGWTNKYFFGMLNTIWHTNTKGDSAEFKITAPSSGDYDLYYYLEKPAGSSNLASSATVTVETGGGISGGEIYTKTIDFNSSGGYVYIGRYTLLAADNTAYAKVTVTNSAGDGCLSATKMKAVRVY